MALSRKHFERVAEILGTTNVPEETMEKFVQFFYEENPRFDYDRFYDAVDKHAQAKLYKDAVEFFENPSIKRLSLIQI